MPVTGLPVALERTLTALLTDNAITSWKVVGSEGENVTIVFRMEPLIAQSTMVKQVASGTAQVHQYSYRRKPPSQVRRDVARSKQHHERQASEVCVVRDSVHAVPTQTVEPQLEDSAVQCSEGHVHLNAGDDSSESDSERSTADVSPLCADAQESAQIIKSTVGGFSTEVVKDYAEGLTDTAVHKRLKDEKRNKLLRRVVKHQSDSSSVPVLICESDDIVVEYTGTSDEDYKCVFFYVKQSERQMTTEEQTRLAYLRQGRRVDRQQREDISARARRDIGVLLDLTLFYLT